MTGFFDALFWQRPIYLAKKGIIIKAANKGKQIQCLADMQSCLPIIHVYI
jgi:hypothetical protein